MRVLLLVLALAFTLSAQRFHIDQQTQGTLPLNRGGTGETTQQAAINALLPSQGSAAGLCLGSDGTNVSWVACAAASGVSGPVSSVSGNVAVWDGTDGDALDDSGKALPTGDVVGTSDTQTLSNKTISGANNTLSNVPQSAVTDLVSDLAAKGDASGPASSTDNALAVYDGTTGKLLKNSLILYRPDTPRGLRFPNHGRIDFVNHSGTNFVNGITVVNSANEVYVGDSEQSNLLVLNSSSSGAVRVRLGFTPPSDVGSVFNANGLAVNSNSSGPPSGIGFLLNTGIASVPRLRLQPIAGDAGSPSDGDIWYNSSTDKFRCREGGSTVNCIGSGGGGGDLSLELDATPIGTEDTLNIITGDGVDVTAGASGGKLSLQFDADYTKLLSRAQNQAGSDILCAPASASTSNYTCALSPVLGTYTEGMRVRFVPDETSAGGAITLNINSVGSVNIRQADGTTDPGAGALVAGRVYDLTYRGSVWRMQPVGSGSGSSTFLDLTDTPASFSGQAGKILLVNSGETALEFDELPAGVSYSSALDFAEIPDGACRDLTFSAAGLTVGTPLAVSLPSTLAAGLVGVALASATDTALVRLCNLSGAAIDPPSLTYTVAEPGIGGAGSPAAWGSITGTLSDQTDLQTALNGKAATTHNHEDANSGGQLGSAALQDGAVTPAKMSAAARQSSKSISIFDPETSDSGKVQFALTHAATLQRVWCSTDTGTVTIQLDERAEATPNTAGTNMLTSSLVCDSNTEATTSFSNATIAAEVPVALLISATSGSPTIVRVHVGYQVN